MSESFHSNRFDKIVWLTNHAIESMAKRQITLPEIKQLIEQGEYRVKEEPHGWIFHHFSTSRDNLNRAEEVEKQAIIIKTVMINWQERQD